MERKSRIELPSIDARVNIHLALSILSPNTNRQA